MDFSEITILICTGFAEIFLEYPVPKFLIKDFLYASLCRY